MTFDVWGHSFQPDHFRLIWIGLAVLATATVFILRRLLPRSSPLTHLLGPFEWSVKVVAVLFILYEFGVVDMESPVQPAAGAPSRTCDVGGVDQGHADELRRGSVHPVRPGVERLPLRTASEPG